MLTVTSFVLGKIAKGREAQASLPCEVNRT
jgi:hypothetical protein